MKRILWNNKHILKRYKITDNNWKGILENYGIVLLNKTKPNLNNMSKISTILKYDIYNSMYGKLWDTSGEIGKPTNDQVYSSRALPLHTDLNYSSITPKYQILCCYKQAIFGGNTILADGLKIKDFFQKHYPLEHGRLAQQSFLFKCSKGIYEDNKKIISDNIIHHNHLDMVDNKHMDYQIWNRLTLDPYFSINYLLSPNEALIIDNHRILHGRQSFIGYRNMIGCYLNS